MTEEEYIDATNLTKARILLHTLRDILEDGVMIKSDERSFLIRGVRAWVARLERAVSPTTKAENKEPWLMRWPKEGEAP